eukprot:m51a1_g11355 hypothetical protein (1048) ;mRNA; f:230-6876
MTRGRPSHVCRRGRGLEGSALDDLRPGMRAAAWDHADAPCAPWSCTAPPLATLGLAPTENLWPPRSTSSLARRRSEFRLQIFKDACRWLQRSLGPSASARELRWREAWTQYKRHRATAAAACCAGAGEYRADVVGFVWGRVLGGSGAAPSVDVVDPAVDDLAASRVSPRAYKKLLESVRRKQGQQQQQGNQGQQQPVDLSDVDEVAEMCRCLRKRASSSAGEPPHKLPRRQTRSMDSQTEQRDEEGSDATGSSETDSEKDDTEGPSPAPAAEPANKAPAHEEAPAAAAAAGEQQAQAPAPEPVGAADGADLDNRLRDVLERAVQLSETMTKSQADAEGISGQIDSHLAQIADLKGQLVNRCSELRDASRAQAEALCEAERIRSAQRQREREQTEQCVLCDKRFLRAAMHGLTLACSHKCCDACCKSRLREVFEKAAREGRPLMCPGCMRKRPSSGENESSEAAAAIPAEAVGMVDPLALRQGSAGLVDDDLVVAVARHQLSFQDFAATRPGAGQHARQHSCPLCTGFYVYGMSNYEMGAARCTNPRCTMLYCTRCNTAPFHFGKPCEIRLDIFRDACEWLQRSLAPLGPSAPARELRWREAWALYKQHRAPTACCARAGALREDVEGFVWGRVLGGSGAAPSVDLVDPAVDDLAASRVPRKAYKKLLESIRLRQGQQQQGLQGLQGQQQQPVDLSDVGAMAEMCRCLRKRASSSAGSEPSCKLPRRQTRSMGDQTEQRDEESEATDSTIQAAADQGAAAAAPAARAQPSSVGTAVSIDGDGLDSRLRSVLERAVRLCETMVRSQADAESISAQIDAHMAQVADLKGQLVVRCAELRDASRAQAEALCEAERIRSAQRQREREQTEQCVLCDKRFLRAAMHGLTLACSHKCCDACCKSGLREVFEKAARDGRPLMCPGCERNRPSSDDSEVSQAAAAIPAEAVGMVDPLALRQGSAGLVDDDLAVAVARHQLSFQDFAATRPGAGQHARQHSCPLCTGFYVYGMSNYEIGAARCTNPRCTMLYCTRCNTAPFHFGKPCADGAKIPAAS